MKSCFVIAPIGDEGSLIRQRSDKILRSVIRPAVEPLGYVATRGDELPGPGLDVLKNVMGRVVNDDLVVADLTGGNPNVFYELAIRHALGKPLVQLAEVGEKIHFDVANTMVIFFKHRDKDSVEGARESIRRAVCAMEESGGRIDTPLVDLADVLAGIRRLLWPESAAGISAFLKQILKAVRRIRKLAAEADRQQHLKALEDSLRREVRRQVSGSG